MSKEIEGSDKLSRRLRRSRRKKVVTPALVEPSENSSSETESIGSGSETIAGYSSRGYTESESEVVSLEGFSSLTKVNFGGKRKGEEEKMSKKDTSKDSGRGEMPAPGVTELLALMMQDNKRRDGEMERRDELERNRREKEAEIRKEERSRREEEAEIRRE